MFLESHTKQSMGKHFKKGKYDSPHRDGVDRKRRKVGEEVRASKLTATYKMLIVLSSKVRNMHS